MATRKAPPEIVVEPDEVIPPAAARARGFGNVPGGMGLQSPVADKITNALADLFIGAVKDAFAGDAGEDEPAAPPKAKRRSRRRPTSTARWRNR